MTIQDHFQQIPTEHLLNYFTQLTLVLKEDNLAAEYKLCTKLTKLLSKNPAQDSDGGIFSDLHHNQQEFLLEPERP